MSSPIAINHRRIEEIDLPNGDLIPNRQQNQLAPQPNHYNLQQYSHVYTSLQAFQQPQYNVKTTDQNLASGFNLNYGVSNQAMYGVLNLNQGSTILPRQISTDQLTQGINRLALSTGKVCKVSNENLDSVDSGTTSQESNNVDITKSCKRNTNRRRVRNRNSASVCFSSCYKIIENSNRSNEEDSILGMGAYATVKLCRRNKDGKKFAVKIIDKTMKNNTREKCFNELRQLQRCKKAANDQNILQLHEFHEDKDFYYIITDYITGGNLSDRLVEGKALTEFESASICRDMAKALDFLHSQRICHRDIKPQNILCADPVKMSPVILSDFDLSSAAADYNSQGSASSSLGNSYDNDYCTQRRSPYNISPISCYGNISPYSMDINSWSGREFPMVEMKSAVGSPEYMSPEIATRFLIDDDEMGTIEKYTEKTDIWSLGVLLYKCLSGDVPYKAIGCQDIYCQWEEGKSCEDCQISLWEEICQSRLEFRSNHWTNVSDQAKHLVAKMLEPDVERRISAAEILDHPFIRCLGQIERENRRLAQNESANNNDNNIIHKPDCVKKLNLNEQTSNQKFEDSNNSQEQKSNKSKTQEESITDLAKLEAKLLFYLKDRFEFQLNDEQFYEVSLIENDYLYDSNQFNEDSGHPYAGLNY